MPLQLPNGDVLQDFMQCHWCGVWHKHVEASGWWHCPSPTCKSPGAAYWRSKMPSYTEVKNGKHTVQPEDVIAAGRARLEGSTDDELNRAIEEGIAWWQGDREAFERNRERWRGIVLPRPGEEQAPARMRFARIAQELLEDG